MKNDIKELCPNCKTGYDSYLIDPLSSVCPYLSCYNGTECAYYVPIDAELEEKFSQKGDSPHQTH